jgi:hypothetical protein
MRIASIVSPGQPTQGVFGPISMWIGCAALAAAMLPTLNCLQRGQVGVALLYFLLLGYRLLVESRTAGWSFLTGAVFALPIVLKATPLLPVAFALAQQAVAAWHSPWRRVKLAHFGASISGAICGLALYLLFLPAALIGWRTNLHHLDTWWSTVAMHEENALVERFAEDNTTDRNQSLTNAVHHFVNSTAEFLKSSPRVQQQDALSNGPLKLPIDAPLVNTFLLLTRVMLGCLLIPVGYRVARARDRLGQTVAFSLAYLLTLVVCQIARAHYFMTWFPVILFASMWLIRESHPRLAALYAVVPGILVTAHYVFLHSVGAIGLLGLGTAVWYSAVCLTILWLCPTEMSEATISLHAASDCNFRGSTKSEINRHAA